MNYKEMDKKIIPLVKALNKVPGLTTIDSCWGHSGHRNHLYVGMWPSNKLSFGKFDNFWLSFYAARTVGELNSSKLRTENMPGWVQFVVEAWPYNDYPMMRMNMHTQHNPDTKPGVQEKEAGTQLMLNFIAKYVNGFKEVNTSKTKRKR